METADFTFGPFAFDRRRKALSKRGTPVLLGQKAAILLETLLAAGGKPVSKDALMEAAWPGANVEESNLTVQIAALRKILGSARDGTEWIATVQRFGYQLAPRVDAEKASAESAAAEAAPGRGDRPSIAVMAFLNLTSDPEQEYFSDGVAEEIIIALSQMRWLFVIARNSSFAYKGRAVDAKQVKSDLGVRYILEGSVRRSANRLRISAELIDAELGANLWAGRFEGVDDDIFDLQDRVTASVVGAISPKLEAAEIDRVRRKPTGSSGAYDHFLRGMMGFHSWTSAGSGEALQGFYKAADLDPRYGAAYGMAARTYVQRNSGGWMDDRTAEFAETERMARLAVDIGRDDAICLSTAGFAMSDILGRVEDGDALIDRALSLNANLAWAWLYSSWVKTSLGQPELALDRVARAMELSPHDPQSFSFYAARAMACLFAGHCSEAFAAAEAALRDRPDFLLYNCIGAASAALSGRDSDAARIAAHMQRLSPGLTLDAAASLIPIRRDSDRHCLRTGLQRAGVPERT